MALIIFWLLTSQQKPKEKDWKLELWKEEDKSHWSRLIIPFSFVKLRFILLYIYLYTPKKFAVRWEMFLWILQPTISTEHWSWAKRNADVWQFLIYKCIIFRLYIVLNSASTRIIRIDSKFPISTFYIISSGLSLRVEYLLCLRVKKAGGLWEIIGSSNGTQPVALMLLQLGGRIWVLVHPHWFTWVVLRRWVGWNSEHSSAKLSLLHLLIFLS